MPGTVVVMPDVPPSFPAAGGIFDGRREERFLAVAIETLVQDMSPAGDGDRADRLAAYSLGEASPPSSVPEYVELADGRLVLSNPPFLHGEIEISGNGEYVLAVALDSDLQLLIDPPVRVSVEAPFQEALETVEQMLAEIYRTRGRRLEMIDSGIVGPEDFADRR